MMTEATTEKLTGCEAETPSGCKRFFAMLVVIGAYLALLGVVGLVNRLAQG